MIHNPVLPGFNPDPCIFRDESRYYIAVSTFEWVPGVRVYASDDMEHWRYETSVLADERTVAFAGNPVGGSVWAPSMRYHRGRYYLVYSDAKNITRPYKDVDNYLVWATDIHGPWSAPVYLNSSGFDPSLFFDDDGSVYYLNKILDCRLALPNPARGAGGSGGAGAGGVDVATDPGVTGGIVMQRLDPVSFALLDAPRKVFAGTVVGKTEGPQLYRRGDWYYLLTAEGGTERAHQVTVSRSRNVWGPYEPDPSSPLLTSRDDATLPLQCAGHGSLVRTDAGDWFMAHLATRPLHDGTAPLGRETALQRVVWDDDGWLRLAQGGHHPALDVPGPGECAASGDGDVVPGDGPGVCASARVAATDARGAAFDVRDTAADVRGTVSPARDAAAGARGTVAPARIATFDPRETAFHDPLTGPTLDVARWNTARELPGDWLSFSERGMRITGGATPRSAFGQHLVGTRRRHRDLTATVEMTYEPTGYLTAAGMLLYLDLEHYLFLAVTCDPGGQPVIVLMEERDGGFAQIGDAMPCPWTTLRMTFELRGGALTCRVRGVSGDDDACRDDAGVACDAAVGGARIAGGARDGDAADSGVADAEDVHDGVDGGVPMRGGYATGADDAAARDGAYMCDDAVDGDGRVDGDGTTAGDAAVLTIVERYDTGFLSGGYTGQFIALDCIDRNVRDATAAVFRDFTYASLP